MDETTPLKLYMLLLGSKAPERNIEQHDFFFGIARNLYELVPELKAFWPEAGKSLHVDGWREVTHVDGYEVTVSPKTQAVPSAEKLFFINMGGYRSGTLEEQHYTVLGVHQSRAEAVQEAKRSIFYKQQSVKGMKGANSHIDEKYGIDVDDVYQIEDILAGKFKKDYQITLTATSAPEEDTIHLGYLTLEKLSKAAILQSSGSSH